MDTHWQAHRKTWIWMCQGGPLGICVSVSPYIQNPTRLFAHFAPQGLLQPLGIKYRHCSLLFLSFFKYFFSLDFHPPTHTCIYIHMHSLFLIIVGNCCSAVQYVSHLCLALLLFSFQFPSWIIYLKALELERIRNLGKHNKSDTLIYTPWPFLRLCLHTFVPSSSVLLHLHLHVRCQHFSTHNVSVTSFCD